MKIGELVELNTVLGYRVPAIVRRKHGAMYGFEFLGLTDEQQGKIRAKCQNITALPQPDRRLSQQP